MLKVINSDDHSITFTIFGRTNSYNIEKNLEIYNQSPNPIYLRNLLRKCVENASQLSGCEGIDLDDFNNRDIIIESSKKQNYRDGYLINSLFQDNPWALFNECYTEDCYLNRLQYPAIRYYFDQQFYIAFTKLAIDKEKELKIASYYPGYFFHDLVIANELISRGYKNFHFYMLIGRAEEFIQLAKQTSDPQLLEDDNIERLNWAICYLWRFTKFIEYLESLNVKVKITILDQFTDQMGQMDVSIAFDFLDDMTGDPSFIYKNVIKYTRVGGLFYSSWQQGLFTSDAEIDCTILSIKNNDYYVRVHDEVVFKHHGSLNQTLITSSKWMLKMSMCRIGQIIKRKIISILGLGE